MGWYGEVLISEAIEFENKAKKNREVAAKYYEQKSKINIGIIIFDKDANKLAKVSGLEKGCIDFSAKYLDGSYHRGYNFTVENWRLATEEELVTL